MDTTKLIEEAKALMAKEPPLCWSKDYIRLLPELAAALAASDAEVTRLREALEGYHQFFHDGFWISEDGERWSSHDDGEGSVNHAKIASAALATKEHP